MTENTSIRCLDHQSRLEEFQNTPSTFDSCLIVDDSALNRKLLEKHLKPYFSTIHTAINGLEAISAVDKMKENNKVYDLICLDSVMPVIISFHFF